MNERETAGPTPGTLWWEPVTTAAVICYDMQRGKVVYGEEIGCSRWARVAGIAHCPDNPPDRRWEWFVLPFSLEQEVGSVPTPEAARAEAERIWGSWCRSAGLVTA